MWINFGYVFDEYFQHDDVEIYFSEESGDYELKEDKDENIILHVKAHSSGITVEEILKEDYYRWRDECDDWGNYEIYIFCTIKYLRKLSDEYDYYESFNYNEIEEDEIESSQDSDNE